MAGSADWLEKKLEIHGSGAGSSQGDMRVGAKRDHRKETKQELSHHIPWC